MRRVNAGARALKGMAGAGLLLALCGGQALGEIRLPSFFSDGMVLQQETGAPVWGWAEPGTRATVGFAGRSMEAVADQAGRWKVVFEGLEASGRGRELTITSGGETRTIQEVLVGEVWLASGQSNMAWIMKKASTRDQLEALSDPLIRHYRGARVAAGEPCSDSSGKWEPATPRNVRMFSAVAFHFAEKLHRELDVPVGIIEAAWGGMPIETFISNEAIRRIPEGMPAVERMDAKIRGFDEDRVEAEYQQELKDYEAAHRKWNAEGEKGRAPAKPGRRGHPGAAPGRPSTVYQGMIHPFVGYGMRGTIWYQGESNESNGEDYGELLEGLVADWRARWDAEFSFYWVQLANLVGEDADPDKERGWVHVQDEQRRALGTIARSGMAVTNDIGGGLHPGNKEDVGLRLARWALHRDHASTELRSGGVGRDVVPSGPLYKSTRFDGGKATVSFDHAAGLMGRDGEKPGGFELAGPDGKWVRGGAVIEGGTVVVSAPSVHEAAMVRYAWARNPEDANLVNAAGLPASCFSSRTE